MGSDAGFGIGGQGFFDSSDAIVNLCILAPRGFRPSADRCHPPCFNQRKMAAMFLASSSPGSAPSIGHNQRLRSIAPRRHPRSHRDRLCGKEMRFSLQAKPALVAHRISSRPPAAKYVRNRYAAPAFLGRILIIFELRILGRTRSATNGCKGPTHARAELQNSEWKRSIAGFAE